MSTVFSRVQKKCVVGVLLLALLVPVVQPQEAVAQGRPVVDRLNVIQNTYAAGTSAVTAGLQNALNVKELTLDGIAYGLTRVVIQSMVRSIVNWINSGFQGSPAFMTDLQGYLNNIADQVVEDFIYGADLGFLCSPFELDVRIALATSYNRQRQGFGAQAQCTLDDVTTNIDNFLAGSFEDGGWAGWFELTQGETNDPNRAYFAAQLEMNAAIRNAQGEAVTELNWGDGFLSFKVCSDTQVQSGAETDCTITTPGTVIAAQLNETLAIGGRGLIEADEINEILGALLAQLAQQALTGVYGLLGMGGNSAFSQNNFGVGNNSSYLDALAVENPIDLSPASTTRASALNNSIMFVDEYLNTQYEIESRVAAARADHITRSNGLEARGCSAPAFPATLQRAGNDAALTIGRFEILDLVLTELRTRLLATTDPASQGAIMNEYLALELDGLLISQIDVIEAQLFIEYDLIEDITDLTQDLASSENRCS